jgi:hypothetical protein
MAVDRPKRPSEASRLCERMRRSITFLRQRTDSGSLYSTKARTEVWTLNPQGCDYSGTHLLPQPCRIPHGKGGTADTLCGTTTLQLNTVCDTHPFFALLMFLAAESGAKFQGLCDPFRFVTAQEPRPFSPHPNVCYPLLCDSFMESQSEVRTVQSSPPGCGPCSHYQGCINCRSRSQIRRP